MRIVFDTNVVLDALLLRPDAQAAVRLVSAAAEEIIEGLITANTITDIYYIARKSLGNEKTREVIGELLTLFQVIPVTGGTCEMALQIDMDDYEDAVAAICAMQAGADYIVTRDQGFLDAQSPVSAVSPKEALELLS